MLRILGAPAERCTQIGGRPFGPSPSPSHQTPPPRQLTADSGVPTPGRNAVILSPPPKEQQAATAQRSEPGGPDSYNFLGTVAALGVALLARDRCLPSAWEEGRGCHGRSKVDPHEGCRRACRTWGSQLLAPRGPPALLGRGSRALSTPAPPSACKLGAVRGDAVPHPPPRVVTAF